MKFSDLEFMPRPVGLGGIQAKKDFPNGFSVSVIKTPFSYGGSVGLYELAVLENGKLNYDNPVADGSVRGHLTEEIVEALMNQVELYPKSKR